MRLTLAQIANILNCQSNLSPSQAQIEVLGVNIDSRKIKAHDLFVCTVGEKVDGHDFGNAASNNGAVAILAEKALNLENKNLPVLVVLDTIKALGQLAKFWREQTKAKVIGITGTAGKTSVKELLAQTLANLAPTAYNYLNFNNQIGMPLAILATSGTEKFWVMEVGISQAHDMDELGSILQPDLAIILNAGNGHSAGLGAKGVAWHKARLLHWLKDNGQALVSADYPELYQHATNYKKNIHFFSTCQNLPYQAKWQNCPETENSQNSENSQDSEQIENRGYYEISLNGTKANFSLPSISGKYATENILAVVAAAHLLGFSNAEIQTSLAKAKLPPQRFKKQTVGKWLIFDDSYNANPLSMRLALKTIAEEAKDRPLVLVLGEMLELGEASLAEHCQLAQLIKETKARALLWHGNYFQEICQEIEKIANSSQDKIIARPDQNPDSLFALLKEANLTAETNGVILFKGSRSNHLETLIEPFSHWAKEVIK